MEGGDDALRTAAEVDAAWLTRALHGAGVGLGRDVVSFDARSIGTGQVGDNIRYDLTWSPVDDPAVATATATPATVVGKFPSTDETSRATGAAMDTYRREVGFYRDVQRFVSVRTPRIHHVGWDPQTHDFVLLMEDIAPAQVGDQLAGCTPEQAERIAVEIVGLHAPTWGRIGELGDLDWLTTPGAERTAYLAEVIAGCFVGFSERYAGRLTDADLAIGAALVEGYRAHGEAVGRWAARHDAWCLTHGDFRLDNLLLGDGVRAPEVTVVDWQMTSVGTGPTDVAYFLGAGLLPDARAASEHRIVAAYAAALRRHGVDVDDEAVWEGYVLGTAAGYAMAVIASQIVERTERGDEMFAVMAERHAAQMRDTRLLERL